MPTAPPSHAAGKTPGPDTPAPANKPAQTAAGATKLSGPAKAMQKLGLRRDIDLALHLPMRYVDETRLRPIVSLRDGDTAQVQGTVLECKVETRSRRQLLVTLADGSGGELLLRLMNFYPSHQKTLAEGQLVRVRGEVRAGFFGREMVHPEFRAVQADTPLPQALTPVYPSSAQLPQAYLRKAVASGLARAPLHEVLPPGVVPAGLPPLREAVLMLHHPPASLGVETLEDHSHPAWQRLKFDELLAQQISQLQSQAARARLHAPAFQLRPGIDQTVGRQAAAPAEAPAAAPDAASMGDAALFHRLLHTLPFQLTGAQQRVVQEIAADLALPHPMNRLLQGDVGSGKTVVAALAAAITMGAGWQCALMAPTEILAEQHFRKLVQWLQPLGVQTAWLTGSRKGRARQQMVEQLASGQALLAVGTHAVISEDVAFLRLGLAIVDEQHRFGVAQRLALRAKLGPQTGADPSAPQAINQHPLEPHLLMMSATPIPRTLAMSYYADLAVSTIDELPPGRTPIVTKVFADDKRAQVVQRIQQEVAQGRQVYWVCPLVEESEHLDLQNATATHAELAAVLGGYSVGLLHGRMAAKEKAAVMAQFTSGSLHLLVATTVIEVGVDVPNASLMVIEHAERFGLAQLHQLRGRVGRGAVASVCVLLYTGPLSPTGKERLKAMAQTNDGFEIARRDLDIRGPGEFMGARQSGDALLRFADLAADSALLQTARQLAPRLLREHPAAAQAHAARWLDSRTDYLKA